jgi:A/G-specific adenine glycosylase
MTAVLSGFISQLKYPLEREYRLAQNSNSFPQIVLQWFARNGRDFPWRKTKNPYHIFIAEILLRRTQATRIIDVYKDLIERYPTPEALSRANLQELRCIFKSIGLFGRADRLIDAAKLIVKLYDGLIPNNVDLLSTLPGMGIYSSRAVLCLSFNMAVPMVDESSGRLLRRVLNLKTTRPAYSDRELLRIANTIIPFNNARNFNLGLLDIASAYCHHRSPECPVCPLRINCSYSKGEKSETST